MDIENSVVISEDSYIGNKNSRNRVDWDLIETDYVQGYYEKDNKVIVYPTHQNLADKFGVKLQLIRQRSSKHNWTMKRETYRDYMRDQRLAEFSHERVLRMSISQGDTIRRLERLDEIVEEYLEKHGSTVEKIVGDDVVDEDFVIEPKDLVNLQKVLAENNKLRKEIFGVPKSYEDIHKNAQEDIKVKLRDGEKVNASDVADLINSLKEKTVDVQVEDVSYEHEN